MKEIHIPEPYQNIFILLFTITSILLLLNKLWYNKRLTTNISKPNIYIFEYESQSGYVLSVYNINSILFEILSYTLYIIAILKTGQTTRLFSVPNTINWKTLLLITTVYFALKIIFETVYIFLIKQNNFLNKIRFIRRTYEYYTFFYLFFAAFLVFYFPYQSPFFFYLIITISSLWMINIWTSIYISLRKHTEMKTYQNILYLCLSEILPFILTNGWIIFQIL